MLRPVVNDDFEGALDARWTRMCPGGGTLETAESVLRLMLPSAAPGRYSDAQIDDYSGLRLRRFPWRPPLRMEVRARASHPALPAGGTATDAPQRALQGTAGFGFWNYPLTAAGGIPRLPDAVWFFAASPPSNMALVPGSPGNGWKAQVVHAHRLGALAAGLPAAGAVGWARLTGREAAAARWIERLTGTHEVVLGAELTEWHEYALEWRAEEARFRVDGALVLAAPDPPRGPLGFVAWIDNQYAVATPRGALRFGTLASGREWLALDWLRITPLES
jgi:hypothetical protein